MQVIPNTAITANWYVRSFSSSWRRVLSAEVITLERNCSGAMSHWYAQHHCYHNENIWGISQTDVPRRLGSGFWPAAPIGCCHWCRYTSGACRCYLIFLTFQNIQTGVVLVFFNQFSVSMGAKEVTTHKRNGMSPTHTAKRFELFWIILPCKTLEVLLWHLGHWLRFPQLVEYRLLWVYW